MSGFLKNSSKHCDCASTVSQSGSSMRFWGHCCETGKQYLQVVGRRFRITMAVLDPRSFSRDAKDKTVSLLVMRDDTEYLLCVLKHEEIPQVSLNLIFDKGENVKFYIKGNGKVFLSGYQLSESEEDVFNDENGYLCPLVEVKTDVESPVMAESEIITTNRKAKIKANKVISEKLSHGEQFWSQFDFDKVDDDSDEDFSIGNETESDEDVSSEEDSIEEEELDEDGTEIILNSNGSQKRRKQEKALPKKRSKNSSSNLDESSEGVMCIEDNDSDDGTSSGRMNSSVGNTPMQKKQVFEAASAKKKKSKKKKMLSEISDILGKSMNDQNQEQQLETPNAESTPNKKGGKHPILKLQGGVEAQDVIVGKGPVATKGKMVHVFYIARFQNKKVFDSRLPGKKPFSFKIGANQVIKGWDVGLLGMRVGGKRKLKVPPNMAYEGKNVAGIPPNSTCFFLVELQAIS